ncbi:MAG: M20/M25/M40 family metallo-hydrolase [Spirochaetales bacterium]|nr:M20/M25/M40 family metallo-hydrolase [Spirochaetales bacterium]
MQQGQTYSGDALERLAGLIRVKTESFTEYEKYDMSEFSRFKEVFRETYRRAVDTFEEIEVSPLSIVYRWEGLNPDLKPALFIGHYDVVGAEPHAWSHPPYDGIIEDGFLYGRGTLDIKQQLAAYMEGVQILLESGFTPERTIYFAFGGDEEVSGTMGAGKISRWFEEAGIKFEYLMDEGGIISTEGMKAFTSKPVALIGIEEKGMMSLYLSCSDDSGHSSMPPKHTAIGRLAEAIRKIENNPFPPRLENSVVRMLKEIGRNCRFPLNLLFKLMPLTNPLIIKAFSKANSTNSMIRTSQSVTLVEGGTRENVLPSFARAVINFRILPGETMDSVKSRIEGLVKGMGIEVGFHDGWPPCDPIPAPQKDTEAFSLVKETIHNVFPGVIAVPFLVNGSTDSKYYRALTDNIFRFTPDFLSSADLERIHGVDERISGENFEGMIKFYTNFIKKTCG